LEDKQPYIIAEIGSVHDGSLGNAKKLVKLAKSVGANCVKFQMHLADLESKFDAPSPTFFDEESRYEYFNRTSFSFDQWSQLKIYAEKEGIDFLISPFSIEAVQIIRSLGIYDFKIPSGELSNVMLLREVAKNYNKVFLSTGMSDMKEIDSAIKVFGENLNNLILMQCTSLYPCPLEKVGINVLDEFSEIYGLQTGFSDHTRGMSAAILALAKGAKVIEKHLTFSRNMYGSDAWNALEPLEFEQFCREIRDCSKILNSPVDKNDLSDFEFEIKTFKKGIYARKSLPKGHEITINDLIMLKPFNGIAASEVDSVVGRILKIDVKEKSALELRYFE
jgi:N,N'-diacetyllegionaminate synthase